MAGPDEVPAFAYDLETSTEENAASNEDAYLPVTEAEETTISVQIANITRVALITVVYNKPLNLSERHLVLNYEQMSDEA